MSFKEGKRGGGAGGLIFTKNGKARQSVKWESRLFN